jgi:hypothetical protein
VKLLEGFIGGGDEARLVVGPIEEEAFQPSPRRSVLMNDQNPIHESISPVIRDLPPIHPGVDQRCWV